MTPHLGRLAAAASTVVQALLTEDEIEQMHVIEHPGSDGRDGPEVHLTVTARGEVSRHFLWCDGWVEESPEELSARIASELQDFISESRFGWGEQRPWPPVPRA